MLLAVLCISIAPRAIFHDLVASHSDKPGCTERHTGFVLHQQELDCHFDDLVVHVPFLGSPEPGFQTLTTFHCSISHNFYAFHLMEVIRQQENRGPPAV